MEGPAMNPGISFSEFNDNAKVWIYAFDNPLSETDKRTVEDELNQFVSDWNSHGAAVKGKFIIVYNRFVILTAKCAAGISGCSIDSSVKAIKRIREKYNLNALDQQLVHYREGLEINCVERSRFQELISSGKINEDTLVFNNTIQSLGELRAGLWETKAGKSWHVNAFAFAS
jgi:hypothetical protein